MAYTNFIPTVWNEAIDRDLEGTYVFADDCYKEYEGKISKKGESIIIPGIGKPTIKTIGRKEASKDIDGPEEVDDTGIIMIIDQMSYFNYMVGDVDKAQAIGGVMDALQKETTEGLADEVDKYISGKVLDSNVPKLKEEDTLVTKDNVLDLIDQALVKLYQNNVKTSTYISLTISPRFWRLFKQAYVDLDTNNSAMIKNGKVAMYGNVTVKMSNNVKTSNSGNTDNIMLRTRKAIAFAKPLTHTEAYRPEKKFADAVKGFILYDAKVTRPKEIVNINVKYQ